MEVRVVHHTRDTLLARRIAADLTACGIPAHAERGDTQPLRRSKEGPDGHSAASVTVVLLAGGAGRASIGKKAGPLGRLFRELEARRVLVARLEGTSLPADLTQTSRVVDVTDYPSGFEKLLTALREGE